MSSTRDAVHERYRAAALRMVGQSDHSSSCGASGCCGGPAVDAEIATCGTGYRAAELTQVSLEASVSLGCGNPLLLAELHPGETVLDLGSGGGLDVLLSARRVGPSGRAYGIDMTDEMLELARQNQRKAGLRNVEFLKGTIEQIPLADSSVDVIISNCVINLSADKPAVFREAFRVLRPGGRFAVTDVVADPNMDDETRQDMQTWTGCIAGALTAVDFRRELANAGFEAIEIEETHPVHEHAGSSIVRARRPY